MELMFLTTFKSQKPKALESSIAELKKPTLMEDCGGKVCDSPTSALTLAELLLQPFLINQYQKSLDFPHYKDQCEVW